MISILDKIRRAGGRVIVRDQAVRIEAPPGLLSDQDRMILAQHRETLLRLLAPAETIVDDPDERQAVQWVEALTPAEAAVVVEAAVRDLDQVVGSDQPDQDQAEPEVEVVEDLDRWLRENTIEPAACDKCGGLDRWEDLAGGWHCSACDPPLTAARIRERAARLRPEAPGRKPAWPIDGAVEVLTLTPGDLPPAPWREGSLQCFDSGRLLNEIKIDLQVIGAGGVNHRSGRLRRDVAAILATRRRYAGLPR